MSAELCLVLLHLNGNFQLSFIRFVLFSAGNRNLAGINGERAKMQQKDAQRVEMSQNRIPGARVHFLPILTRPGTKLHLWQNWKRSAGTSLRLRTELKNISRDQSTIKASRRTERKRQKGLNSIHQKRKGPRCKYRSRNAEGPDRANTPKLARV